MYIFVQKKLFVLKESLDLKFFVNLQSVFQVILSGNHILVVYRKEVWACIIIILPNTGNAYRPE